MDELEEPDPPGDASRYWPRQYAALSIPDIQHVKLFRLRFVVSRIVRPESIGLVVSHPYQLEERLR